MLLLEHFDTVNLFGFSNNLNLKKYHYYDIAKKGSYHNLNKEYKFLKSKMEKIKIYE